MGAINPRSPFFPTQTSLGSGTEGISRSSKKETPRKQCEDNSNIIISFVGLTKNVDNFISIQVNLWIA